MIENNLYINYISHLYDALRRAFFSKNIGFSVIRLIFIKYASDNCLGAFTREEMQDYMRIQRIFAARDVEAGPDSLVPILDMLDRHYQLPNLMHNSINEYAKELFGLDDSWVKKNTSDKNFAEIMSIISSMDLTDDLDTHENGMELALNLIDNLQYHGENARLASPFYSKRELGAIANKILNVNDEDVFLDFCSGIGTTTISAVGSKKCKIINRDINEECLSVAAMLYMMCGYEGFEIGVQDQFPSEIVFSEYNGQEKDIADKIFVEAPLGVKIKEHPLRDSSLISLGAAATLLKENGTAVVTVPASALFTQFGMARSFRQTLLESGMIQCVVALPFTYTRTSIPMFLVILSKKQRDAVLFVNFASFATKSAKFKGGNSLSDANLDTLLRIINNNEEVNGVSRFASFDEIQEKEFDITPMSYVSEIVKTEDITLDEIDAKLIELYKKLSNS